MDDEFRFSIRRMLVSVSLFSVAAFIVAFAFKARTSDHAAGAILTAAGTIAGAGLGILFRKTIAGAIFGTLLVGIPIGILVALVGDVCP